MMTIHFNDEVEVDPKKLRRLAQALPGAFYAGPRKIKHLNVEDKWQWHVVSVQMDSGRTQAILCRTQEMAEAIAELAQQAERSQSHAPESVR
jgi:hypothetical protein